MFYKHLFLALTRFLMRRAWTHKFGLYSLYCGISVGVMIRIRVRIKVRVRIGFKVRIRITVSKSACDCRTVRFLGKRSVWRVNSHFLKNMFRNFFYEHTKYRHR